MSAKEALFSALTDPYIEQLYQIYDQVVEEFEQLSAEEQTRNMSDTSSDGMNQIIEHDIDRKTAKKNVNQLKEFNTGGWERLWNIKFPVKR